MHCAGEAGSGDKRKSGEALSEVVGGEKRARLASTTDAGEARPSEDDAVAKLRAQIKQLEDEKQHRETEKQHHQARVAKQLGTPSSHPSALGI